MTVFLSLVNKQVESFYNVRVAQNFKIFVLAFEHTDKLTVCAPKTLYGIDFSSEIFPALFNNRLSPFSKFLLNLKQIYKPIIDIDVPVSAGVFKYRHILALPSEFYDGCFSLQFRGCCFLFRWFPLPYLFDHTFNIPNTLH